MSATLSMSPGSMGIADRDSLAVVARHAALGSGMSNTYLPSNSWRSWARPCSARPRGSTLRRGTRCSRTADRGTLRNVLERAAVLSDEGVIERHHLSWHAKPIAAASPTDLSAIERQTIDTVLRETDGNKSKTRGAWASRARSCTSGSAATASRIRRRHSIAP
jgi:hypothetical protein